MAISVVVRSAPAARAIQSLAAALRDAAMPNRALAAQLYGWTIRNYDSRGSLQPKPWVPLVPATAKEKIRLGYSPEPLAPRSGNLRQSFAPFSDAEQAGVGARASYGIDYAEVHEHGSGTVPARPMLPTRAVGEAYATRIYGHYIAQAKKKAGL
jgi:phage gpG-like protein